MAVATTYELDEYALDWYEANEFGAVHRPGTRVKAMTTSRDKPYAMVVPVGKVFWSGQAVAADKSRITLVRRG